MISTWFLHAVYFLVRTVPFWAIPLALIGLTSAIVLKNKRQIYLSVAFVILSILLVALTVMFFWNNGQAMWVPLLNDVLNS